ncbi:kinase-like protein [Rhizophagus irregularis]|uniref:non-specific serine/threonine protein kinase n=3 Tax=Rhizophagus irregularis TaxID=588596 RepID=A0A2N0Q9N4_9GLOM|nr:kinase-like domain-containing protein [Rhizophagus irregularis DAOM 181602=DAOM 197198]PKC15739.1 kinase-like protein [Rhizophagus irregularis]POG82640.1 kinase-like domain-containing protein [Rhizophagus irregularis DAOM 181602=DAOM 197198]|eukprot:XP_025189506.1 kinase-like domain-containing protein [Rhizophagus irregularis DAOM 181602=DAOM 197198]
MTTNIRSIDIKGVVSNKTRIKSKFFASTPSSEESSSNEDTTGFFIAQKKKNDNKIINEELLLLNTKEYPQTPGSLDNFDGVLTFKKDDEFDGNNRHPLETVIASSSNPAQITRYNPDYESILESKRRQSRLLLVSLLENFCLLYDTNPERNHKTFYLICKTLSAMGIIEEEYIDEMSTVRSSYQRAFKDLLVQALNSIKQEQSMKKSHMIMDSAESTNTDENIVQEFPDNLSKHSQMFKNISFEDILDLQNSRYSNDFIELKLLGKGGFANVWQAKNKLDGIEYAIKKVRLQGDRIPEEKEKIFREIKFLARLEHKNVIRYYSSWLEHTNNKQRDVEMSVSSYSNSKSSNESSMSNSNNMCEDGSQDDSDIFRMSFSSDEQRSEDFSGIDFVGDDISAVGGLHSSSHSLSHDHSYDIETSENSSSDENIAQVNMNRDWILLIQMQLCHSSLRDYLKRRDANLLATKKDPLNAIDRHASIELFRGIIHGVAYIHSQGLIHRDLKPGNIFMGIIPENGSNNQNSWVAADCSSFAVERLVPKIGDFGLVTAVDGVQNGSPIDDVLNSNFLKFIDGNRRFDVGTQRSSVSSSYNSKSRTTGVGTITYASPEQLAKPSCPYNEKVDIYSLGIIFFELHFPFSTGHERVRVLKDLRNGILPKGFVERFPKEAAFILWMMAEDPDKRPNSKQILDFELLAGPIDGEHAEMQHRLVQSTQRLDMMTKENEMLKNKVAELEEKLKNCECGGGNYSNKIYN